MEQWDFGDNHDRSESFSRVNLKLEQPANKKLQFTFTCDTERLCKAYNRAISEVANREQLSPFHQAGGNSQSEHMPGYHAWELWMGTDEEKLRNLMSEIHSTAERYFTLI